MNFWDKSCNQLEVVHIELNIPIKISKNYMILIIWYTDMSNSAV